MSVLSADGLSVRVKQFAPFTRLSLHRHESAYCCLLLSGDAAERQGEARFDLSPASFTVRQPGSLHSVDFGSEPATAVVVELDVSRFDRLISAGFDVRPEAQRASGAALAAAARLRRELPARDAASRLLVEGLALELLGAAFRDRPRADSSVPPEWLRRIHERLAEGREHNVTMGRLAGEAGVAPSHLATSFRAWYGESPGDLVRRRRFESAAADLRDGALSLAEIAQRAGYYDQSHFTNDLKRRTGLTPGQLRAALGGSSPD